MSMENKIILVAFALFAVLAALLPVASYLDDKQKSDCKQAYVRYMHCMDKCGARVSAMNKASFGKNYYTCSMRRFYSCVSECCPDKNIKDTCRIKCSPSSRITMQ